MNETIHATTVICVRRDGEVAMAGDGQVTVGNTVMKHGAAKVRRLYHDKIIAGFAGSAADAFALFSRFEAKLEEYRGNMERSVVELAKDWRLDKYLRQLQAFLIVANNEKAYLISGTGDLIHPDHGLLAIRRGGSARTRRWAHATSPSKRCASPPRSASTRTTTSPSRAFDHGHRTSRKRRRDRARPADAERDRARARQVHRADAERDRARARQVHRRPARRQARC